MKLDSEMVERALDQFEAEALPDDHPAVPKLSQLFGDHTFFVDDDGLHIIEPGVPAAAGQLIGNVMTVARWDGADRSRLSLQKPEPADIVVDLGSALSDPAA